MILNKKIISFDLDGTLSRSKTPVTKEMAGILKDLIRQKEVVVISGGGFNQFKTQFLPPFSDGDFLSLFGKNLILLPTSGSQRYDYNVRKNEWEMTHKEDFPKEIKERVKKEFQKIIDSGDYGIPPNPAGEIIEDRDTQITFSALGQKADVALKSSWDPDQTKRKKITAAVEPYLPEVSMLINAYSSIDVLPKGFDKGVGLKLLLEKLGYEKSDFIFVGDGLFPGGNDYAVHEAGFETIAVKGPEEVAAIIRQWFG